MRRSLVLVALFGVLASRTVYAQLQCAGAEGASTACADPCSNTVVNSENPAGTGKFNVGGGNQGDGNDGFSNIGNFNIASGAAGNCLSAAEQTTGSCDIDNNQGRIVLRFCQVYPTDNKCQPSGYLAEYTDALKPAIAASVAVCNGGPPLPPIGTSVPTPAGGPPPDVSTPPTSAPPTDTPTKSPPAVLPPSESDDFTEVSDNKGNLLELLKLFEEHITKEKALGRKMK